MVTYVSPRKKESYLCQNIESTITVSNRATAPVAIPVKAVFTNSIYAKYIQWHVKTKQIILYCACNIDCVGPSQTTTDNTYLF